MRNIRPFYVDVVCRKIIGGKKPLWHARKKLAEGAECTYAFTLIGAGNTADNAIRDLQRQMRK